MYRLGIVSDSHGIKSHIELAAAALGHCDAITHLGDTVSDAEQLKVLLSAPVLSVRGNCDSLYAKAPEELTVTISGTKLLMVHGHRQRVKDGLTALWLRAEEAGCQIALYGHTHRPCVERAGGVMLVNPGALMDGRYAILEFREHGAVPVMKIL